MEGSIKSGIVRHAPHGFFATRQATRFGAWSPCGELCLDACSLPFISLRPGFVLCMTPFDNSTRTVQNLPRMAYSNSPREDAKRVPVEQIKWLEDMKQWEMNVLSTLRGTKDLGPGVVVEGHEHLSSLWGVGSLDARSHDSNATHDLQKRTRQTKYKIKKSERERYKRHGLNGVIEELSDVVNLDFKDPRLQFVKDTKMHTVEKASELMRTQRSMIDQLNHCIDVEGKKAYHLKADIANTKNDVRLLTQEKEIIEAKVKRYVDSFEKEQYKWLPIGLYNADAAREATSQRMEVEAAGLGLAAEAEAARMLAEAARKREEAAGRNVYK